MTAASASPFTDGASATLLMSDGKASELGLSPKARHRPAPPPAPPPPHRRPTASPPRRPPLPQAELLAYAFVACDPFEELLLGPTYGASKVLRMAGLSLKDIDVIEFHEAFAGQARPLSPSLAPTLSMGPRAGMPSTHVLQPMSTCGCSLCHGGLVSLLHEIEMDVRACAGARQPGGARFR